MVGVSFEGALRLVRDTSCILRAEKTHVLWVLGFLEEAQGKIGRIPNRNAQMVSIPPKKSAGWAAPADQPSLGRGWRLVFLFGKPKRSSKRFHNFTV